VSAGRPLPTSWPAAASASSSSAGPLGPVARIFMACPPPLRLLADDIDQRLPLLVAHHVQRLLEPAGQPGGVFDLLPPAARGPTHHLIVGGRVELIERHGLGAHGPPV